MLPRGRRIRLAPGVYHDPHLVCSITIAALDRRPLFHNYPFAQACLEVLRLPAHGDTAVHAYCFMPDHVHLVLSPSPTTGITEFVGQFKGKTTRLAWSHGYRGRIWQSRACPELAEGFYDQFVRNEEGLGAAVLYVLNNPVREGLVGSWRQYRFAGSWTLEL